MLLTILAAAAALSAAGIAGLSGAYCDLSWLWVLPVSFVGSFVVYLLLAFCTLLIVCACIDPDKPREKDSPWFRRMILWYIDAILTILPVHISSRGTEKLPKDTRFLLVCNHLHNVDPAFVLKHFPKTQLSFVAKREAKDMFLLGKVLPKLLCPYINRENDREALKTILRSISLIKNDVVSIGIFPEGRINSYRKLAHFRPGVFKIAQKAKVPVVVCTLSGTENVLKNAVRLKRSDVAFHLLDVIPVEEVLEKSTVELAEQAYQLMAADLGPDYVLTPEEEENA